MVSTSGDSALKGLWMIKFLTYCRQEGSSSIFLLEEEVRGEGEERKRRRRVTSRLEKGEGEGERVAGALSPWL